MASRNLGTLTVDLIAKIGGFTKGMTEAERVADKKSREMKKKMQAHADDINKAWQGVSRVLAAAFAGITVGAAFRKVITETSNAQREQALLAAALKATGDNAGYSQARLNEMAGQMEGLTTISAGEFNQAQTVLLGFTNIVGVQLPKALQAAADYSTRTGADMASAAETIGRALDIPSAGMCVHVGLVVEVDGRMLILETDHPGGACLTPINRFQARFTRVLFFDDQP